MTETNNISSKVPNDASDVGCYTDAHLKNQKKTWRDSALAGLDAPRFFLVFQVGFDNILVGFPRPRKKINHYLHGYPWASPCHHLHGFP